MKEFKGTKGEWFISYIGGIPIGVHSKIEIRTDGIYSQTIVETLLPDSDEDWEKEEEETTANLKLIAAAPELLEACLKRIAWSKKYPSSKIYSMGESMGIIKQSDAIDSEIANAINKAI
jgi:hypothetical protein